MFSLQHICLPKNYDLYVSSQIFAIEVLYLLFIVNLTQTSRVMKIIEMSIRRVVLGDAYERILKLSILSGLSYPYFVHTFFREDQSTLYQKRTIYYS